MQAQVTPLRVVEPLSLYFRPGRNDHTALAQLLSSGAPAFTGAVLDASLDKRQEELRLLLQRQKYETVLDPMALELGTLGGYERRTLRHLKWAGEEPHSAVASLDSVVDAIAEFAVERRYSAVLAPTHYITGVDDPWWRTDLSGALRLRRLLNDAGQGDTSIYYRLALSRKVLLNPDECRSIVARLSELEMDAVWLCVHPVGADSSAAVLKSYLDAARQLRSIGVPLIAERTGSLGVASLGFNAVGGIASGITLGETFDAQRLLHVPKKKEDDKTFSASPRVYIEGIDTFMKPKDAHAFLQLRGMRRFACQGRCCAKPQDMISNPRRHFLHTRAAEVADLSKVPPAHRPLLYLDKLRRTSDMATLAAKVDKRLEKQQRRLGDWRVALSNALEAQDFETSVVTKSVGRFRRRKSA